ncbi:carboxypeptidase-like regulatory domain-containing protein [Methanomethylophilus alvi]|uniref:carboxypeptidase-like regulatory domain-containing protein n=1 Tax=Methanomethylophilus alvi TaxID=1291540 RepID=UPI0037DD3555
MRHSAVVAVIAVLALCVPMTLLEDSDSTDAASTTTTYRITGYVNEEFSSGNIGLKGAVVTIYDETGNPLGVCTTSSADAGRFKIDLDGIPVSKMYIGFSLAEYDLRSISSYASEIDTITVATGTAYRLSITTWSASSEDNVRECLITSSTADGLNCFTMATTTGTVTVYVNYGGQGVRGANIEISADDGRSIHGKTDGSGGCTISGLTIGAYTIKVSADGFESEKKDIVVTKGTATSIFEMTEKTHATYLGMDLVHFLMFIGIILGLSLALCARILYHRVGRTKIDEEDLKGE